MALDFEKIKQKVAQLSGQGKKKSILWWPEGGKEYQVRVLPWTDGNDGQPFKERSFYYGIGEGKRMLAPNQFQKADPIQELIKKLRDEGTPMSFDLAKKLYPRREYYAPVIVRGEEGEGVRIWSFKKDTARQMLDHMMGEFGDFTDTKAGRDLIVKCLPSGKKFNGKEVFDVSAMPKIAQTPLGDAKQTKEWTENIPSLDQVYGVEKLLTTDEIEKRANDWLNDGPETQASEGQEAGPEATSDSKPTQTPAPKGKKGKQTEVVSEKEHSDINAAFKELDGMVENDS